MSYADLLKDPRWQRKRLEILNRSNFSCEDCGRTDLTLNVHHKRYRKGAKPWEYSDYELQSLCEGCHEGRHTTEDKLESIAKSLTHGELVSVLEYAQKLVQTRTKAVDDAAAKKAWEEANRLYVTETMREAAKARRRDLIKIGMGRALSADEQEEYDDLQANIPLMVAVKQ